MAMNKCRLCGDELRWAKISTGKWAPFNVGDEACLTDHREVCPGMSKGTREKVREANHEARVREFFAKGPKKAKKQVRRYNPKPGFTGPRDIPPDDGTVPW